LVAVLRVFAGCCLLFARDDLPIQYLPLYPVLFLQRHDTILLHYLNCLADRLTNLTLG
jgi:hypothetical protein